MNQDEKELDELMSKIIEQNEALSEQDPSVLNEEELDELIIEEVLVEELDEDAAKDEQEAVETIVKEVHHKQKGKRGKNVTKTKHKNKQGKQGKDKKGHNAVNGLITLVLLALIVLAGYFAWDKILSVTKIDYFTFNTLEITGAEGHAQYQVNPDRIVFSENVDIETVLKELTVVIEPNEGLSNKDEVTVSLLLSEAQEAVLKENKYKLAQTRITKVVNGLGDADSFDFFSYVNVEFKETGVDVSIDRSLAGSTKEQTKLLEEIGIRAFEANDLANGDVIELELDISDALAEELLSVGISLKETSHSYEVEGLAQAPQTLAELSNFETLKTKASQRIAKDNPSAQNIKVVNACYSADPSNVINATDRDSTYAYDKGSLMFVFEYELDSLTHYDAYGFTNILMSQGIINEKDIKTIAPV